MATSNNDGRARTVGFAIRASVHHPSSDGEGSMDALLDVSEELNEGLLTLTDHQAYMRRREEHHAAVLESTRARVLWWTVAETAVLIALSLWQIRTVHHNTRARVDSSTAAWCSSLRRM